MRVRLLVDRIMGEAGMWEPRLAALAIRQAEGDHIESVHLLRAYKSTLPRIASTEPIHVDEMRLLRRVVPAFRRRRRTSTGGSETRDCQSGTVMGQTHFKFQSNSAASQFIVS